MNVLVIGAGAREHALAVRLKGHDRQVYLAPGNGLAELDIETLPVNATDPYDVARLVRERRVDLVVVGPEAPLMAGIADALSTPVLGPVKAAAMLEASKSFAKRVMQQAGVPTAAFTELTDIARAQAWLEQHPGAHVVKGDGLMAGKGVIVCDDELEALAAVKELFQAGQEKVVVEQRLRGKEASLIALTDGELVQLFPVARDHKRLLTGDQGKNTGGMGAFAPVVLGEEFEKQQQLSPDALADMCITPVLAALRKQNIRYRGFIYAGLMFDAGRVHVLEFNARLGDPETQALLAATQDDLLPSFYAAAVGSLGDVPAFRPCGAAVCIVLAARGYPDAPEVGAPITGIDKARALPHVRVYGAGVKRDRDRFYVNGGRVLSVVGDGNSVEEARARAYAAADLIHFEGMQRREDIAGGGRPR